MVTIPVRAGEAVSLGAKTELERAPADRELRVGGERPDSVPWELPVLEKRNRPCSTAAPSLRAKTNQATLDKHLV